MRLSHTVVICTRHRADDMARCLAHVAASTDLPNVLVVDSSEDDATLDLVEGCSHGIPAGRIRYVRASPGLPHQRNVGLENVDADVVHFIDDDSHVTPDYFERILSTFAARPDAVAVGGMQVRAPLRPPHWTKRLFLLDAPPGRVTKSAYNSYLYRVDAPIQPVEWLSGCAMSFRTSAAAETRFNDDLHGYALGEDMEFCLRVSRLGSILVNTNAWVDHVRSDTNRLDYHRFRVADMAHRALLVRAFPDRFSWVAYAWSAVGLICLTTVRAFRGEKGARDEVRGIRDGLRAALPRRSTT